MNKLAREPVEDDLEFLRTHPGGLLVIGQAFKNAYISIWRVNDADDHWSGAVLASAGEVDLTVEDLLDRALHLIADGEVGNL